MEKINLKQFLAANWRELNCFYPVYEGGANAVTFLLSGGRQLTFDRRVKTVKKSLARFFSVDAEAQRLKYKELFGRVNSLPLVLNPVLVLVPFKTREALAKADGSWGFAVLDKVKKCESCGEGSKIFFQDGSSMETLFRRSTVLEYLQCAATCLTYYKKENLGKGDYLREVVIPDGYVLVTVETFSKLSAGK